MILYDVIFEEGTGHRSLTILNDTDDTPTSDTRHNPLLSAQAPATPGVLSSRQPIAPRTRPGPLYPDDAPTTDPDIARDRMITSIVPADAPPPQPLCRSLRQTRPTPALIAAQETLQREQDAHNNGEDWASGEEAPKALLAEGPYGYLSNLKNYDEGDDTVVLKTYMEAMK